MSLSFNSQKAKTSVDIGVRDLVMVLSRCLCQWAAAIAIDTAPISMPRQRPRRDFLCSSLSLEGEFATDEMKMGCVAAIRSRWQAGQTAKGEWPWRPRARTNATTRRPLLVLADGLVVPRASLIYTLRNVGGRKGDAKRCVLGGNSQTRSPRDEGTKAKGR